MTGVVQAMYVRRADFERGLITIWSIAERSAGVSPADAWEQAANALYAFSQMWRGHRARQDECWFLYQFAQRRAEQYRSEQRAAA